MNGVSFAKVLIKITLVAVVAILFYYGPFDIVFDRFVMAELADVTQK